MKKKIKILSTLIILFFTGIFVFSGSFFNPERVSAEAVITDVEFVNFVLTGGQGYYPCSYFGDGDLIQSTYSKEEIYYYNKNGELTNKYRVLLDKVTSFFSKKYSTGSVSALPFGDMQKLINTGCFYVYGSAGLLALKDDDNSKITISMSSNGQTVSATSDLVYSGGDYRPDWVKTDKIYITSMDQLVTFNFTNNEESSLFNSANFLIFEPTISFGIEIDKINVSSTNSTVSKNQLVKLNGETSLSEVDSDGELVSYYKNFHQVEWEIVEGAELATVSGSYLRITGESGTIKVRAKCRKSTQTDEYIYSDETITYQIDNTVHYVQLNSNFTEGVQLYGAGEYSPSKTETAIFVKMSSEYSFLKFVDEAGNVFPAELTGSGNYRAIVELDSSKIITAVLIKNVKIDNILIEDKIYDKTDTAVIKEVVISGILPEHDIEINNTLSAKFSSIVPAENVYIDFTGGITISGKDAYMYNFNASLPEIYADILKRNITVIANETTKQYGENDPTITYSISEELLIGDVLLGNLSRTIGESVGEYEITIGDLGNPNYLITFVSNTFTIQKRKIEITNIEISNKTYDRTNEINASDISLSISGNLINEEATLNYEASYENFNAGINKAISFNAWISGEDKDSYELIITDLEIYADILPRQILITADEKIKIYGEADPELTYSYNLSDLLEGDFLSGELIRSAGEEVGLYKINIGTLEAQNYEIEFISQNLEIQKRNLTVSAIAKNKIYGDTDPELTYEVITGELLNGDILGLKLKREQGENIGDYLISIESQLNVNYEISFISSNFTIAKRNIVINISTQDKDYDGKNMSQVIVQVLNDIKQDDVSLSLKAELDSINVGEKTVKYYFDNVEVLSFDTQMLTGNISNYEVTFNVDYTSSVNRKQVLVSASENSTITKIYGEQDEDIVYTAVGVAEGEDLFGKLSRTSGENVGTYTINQGTLTDENNSNYKIIFNTDKVFTILKRDVKIVVDNKIITYGDDEGGTYYYLSGETALPDGVVLTDILSGTPTREKGYTYGQYKYLLGSLILKQNIKNNYNLIFEGGYLYINKLNIEIVINNITKTYGEDDPLISYQITSGYLVSTADLSFEREESENVGSYLINPIFSESYNFTFAEGRLNILPATISIKANDIIKTYGDSDPVLNYVISSGTLMFNDTFEDIFTGSLKRTEGENVGEYIINKGTLKSNYNYLVNFLPGTFIIQKKNIVVTANPTSKFLDETITPEFTYETSGLINGDSLSGELIVEGASGLGDYDILIGTLNSENYNITFISSKYSIIKRSLYININYVSKEYDGTNLVDLTYEVSGDIAEGDENNLGIVLTKQEGYSVGKYLITASLSNEKYVAQISENYFEILPREITIKADDINIIYGDAVPDSKDWTYTVTGQIINNELKVSLYRTQNYYAGTFEILGTITNTSNYDVTFIPGKLTINQKTIYVTVSNCEKIYGQTDPYLNYSLEENALYNGDSLQGNITREEGENVGTYKLICLLTNSNYIVIMNDANLTINPKELVLVATALDKVYDGTAVANLRSPTISGVVEEDDVSLDYDYNNIAKFLDAEVGDNKQVIVFGGQLLGEDAQNYFLTRPTNLTASITISVVQNGDVSVYASKSNTKLKDGTTLVSNREITEEDAFGETKSVLDSYTISLKYNDQSLESYGTVTVSIDLGKREYFNVQIYKVNNDGTNELVKSAYEDGKLSFNTNELGTYIIIAENDKWLDYCLIGISVGFIVLIAFLFLAKERKIKSSGKDNKKAE